MPPPSSEGGITGRRDADPYARITVCPFLNSKQIPRRGQAPALPYQLPPQTPNCRTNCTSKQIGIALLGLLIIHIVQSNPCSSASRTQGVLCNYVDCCFSQHRVLTTAFFRCFCLHYRLHFLGYFRVKYKNPQDFQKFKKVRKALLYQQKTVFRKSSEYRFLWDGCSQRTANAREKAEKRRTSTTRIACRGSRLAGVVKTQFYEMP